MPQFEYLFAGADIAITLIVERKIGAFERAIAAGTMIDHGDVWFDTLPLNQPGKVGAITISAIANQPLGP